MNIPDPKYYKGQRVRVVKREIKGKKFNFFWMKQFDDYEGNIITIKEMFWDEYHKENHDFSPTWVYIPEELQLGFNEHWLDPIMDPMLVDLNIEI